MLADRKYYQGHPREEYDYSCPDDSTLTAGYEEGQLAKQWDDYENEQVKSSAHSAFSAVHRNIKRGDIVGVVGFPGAFSPFS